MPCKTVLSPIAISSQRVVCGSGSQPERPLESGEHYCPGNMAPQSTHSVRYGTLPMQASAHGAALLTAIKVQARSCSARLSGVRGCEGAIIPTPHRQGVGMRPVQGQLTGVGR